jgi:hypothetical protein
MISQRDVVAMLNECAPNHKIELKTHNYFVYFNNLTYPSLPKYHEVEAGHVKKMTRFLNIYDCAKEYFKW